jgi:hypothetical protein
MELKSDDKDAIRFITSWPVTMLFGIGIPGLIATGTIFDLESQYVTAPLTWWLFRIMIVAALLASVFAVSCRIMLYKSKSPKCIKASFVGCVISILISLTCSTICLVLQTP